MKHIALVLLLAIGISACGSAPSAPTGGSSVQLTGAVATAPSTGTVLPLAAQPITVLIAVPTATPAIAVSTAVDVATDSSFLSVVDSEPVATSANGQATVALRVLPAGKYFWRVRAIAGDTLALSATSTFTIGPATTLAAPQLATATDLLVYPRPTLGVARLTGTRPAGLSYQFQISTSPQFLPLLTTVSVTETASLQLFARPAIDLPLGTVFYWRVQLLDPSTGASAYSETRRFTTVAPVTNGAASLFVTLDCAAVLPSRPDPETVPFDGTVQSTATRVLFEGVRAFDGSAGITLDLARSGDSFTGTIGGASSERIGARFGRVSTNFDSAQTIATSARQVSASSISGSFDGYFGLYKVSEDGTGCIASGFRWTLYSK